MSVLRGRIEIRPHSLRDRPVPGCYVARPAGTRTRTDPTTIRQSASPVRAGARAGPVNGSGQGPARVSSENANGLAAPGRPTSMRTVLTPVRGTLALTAMDPSASVVMATLCSRTPLAAFSNRRSSLVCFGSSTPVACRVPQLTRERSAWRWAGWAATGPAPSSASTATTPATGENLSQRICLPSNGVPSAAGQEVEDDLVDVEVAAGGQVAGRDLQRQPRPALAGNVDRNELATAGALDRPAEGVGAGDRLALAVLAQPDGHGRVGR